MLQKFRFYEQELPRLIARAAALAKSGGGPGRAQFCEPALHDLQGALRGLPRSEVRFASTFADLALPKDDRLPASVPGKMAVIHLDGNNFGIRREALSAAPARYGAFSGYLELQRGRPSVLRP
ncbi:MAG: hypothetical protein GC191_04835 [Azospirillum sp.]|nr:hypothetical protein [Azospirillum sp.]